MFLELSEDEARDLRAALETQLDELHDEEQHTDDRRYRRMLQDLRERLVGVARRLDEQLGFAQPHA